MRKLRRLVLASSLTVVTVTLLASSAHAATSIRIAGPASSTATGRNVTLTSSATGTIVKNLTLNINWIPGLYTCGGATKLVQVGIVLSGQIQILTPSGATGGLIFGPGLWTVNFHCTNGVLDVDASGNPIIYILGVQLFVRLNAISTFQYNGSITHSLNAAGNLLTITSSSLVVTPGGGSASLRGSFAIAPALTYTLI